MLRRRRRGHPRLKMILYLTCESRATLKSFSIVSYCQKQLEIEY